ncbi:AraC family transcriptional regulator [Hydrogenophaga sp. PBL-H3]|uniref:AraC family transcriptional regulator n=1 Tax=Hydrogenophaga sp. PBL-H3 TaxID=434010 RepID=UPI00131FD358|nr:helix-turn-helix transcriptional regulator [Hydrogenophaga sp. PBL-H3]QHE76254.1 AraC family transcriptional regulator [Hydrogenophaga sp. PBL-H3]QHE80678.1 AraC family transcriptional regulator [Hydrogenophaga sp. PBL-H3]
MQPSHRRPAPRAVPLGDTDPFRPTPEHPVRCRARQIDSDNQFEPHHHPWGQLAYCARGLLQVTVVHTGDADGERSPLETTTIVPPSRAVWIPPLARHAVTIVESAQLLTLYIDGNAVPAHWSRSRVLVVSPLLRELVHALNRPQRPAGEAGQALLTLLLDEMEHADTQPLGVPMPSATGGDRRLRNLCEAVMQAPAQHGTLAAWAAHGGASERTLARLFRDELGTSFQRWRQQVVLAHALPMLARGVSVGRVAEASGYASESAFSAMFKSAMGLPPTRLREQARTRPQADMDSAARA